MSKEIFPGQSSYDEKMDEIARKFLEDLEKEQNRLKEYFPICNLLIEEGKRFLYLQKFIKY